MSTEEQSQSSNNEVVNENNDLDKGWTKKKQQLVRKWIDTLSYNQIVSYFYVFILKGIENRWAWIIIVLSSITSTISLIQFEDEKYEQLNLVVKILITVFSLLITLIASWMKKQNYVERIGTIDKYLQKINKLIAELEGQIQIDPPNRLLYSQFLEKYKDHIIEYISSMPLINPIEWKNTVYILTRYYPEIISDIEPWKSVNNWGDHILRTYHQLKYRSLWNRITSGYYCLCKCFGYDKNIHLYCHRDGYEYTYGDSHRDDDSHRDNDSHADNDSHRDNDSHAANHSDVHRNNNDHIHMDLEGENTIVRSVV